MRLLWAQGKHVGGSAGEWEVARGQAALSDVERTACAPVNTPYLRRD